VGEEGELSRTRDTADDKDVSFFFAESAIKTLHTPI
jgi:hypothetical protein